MGNISPGSHLSRISNPYRAERNHWYIYTLDLVRKTPRKFWGHMVTGNTTLSDTVAQFQFQFRAWTFDSICFMADVGRPLSFARFPRAVWRFEPMTFKQACLQTEYWNHKSVLCVKSIQLGECILHHAYSFRNDRTACADFASQFRLNTIWPRIRLVTATPSLSSLSTLPPGN